MFHSLRPVVPAPRRSRFACCAPLLLLSSLLACPVFAQTHGTYSSYPTYSGGSITGKAGGSSTPSITQFSAGQGPDSGHASVSATTDSGGNTASCSAQIASSALTATFAWLPNSANPNEPPPSCALLAQTCNISWSFSKDSTSTASGNTPSNGLSNGGG